MVSNRARVLCRDFDVLVTAEGLVVRCSTATVTQKQICDLLAIRPMEAQDLPFHVKAATRYCNVHVFDLKVCLPVACATFGVGGLRERVDKKHELAERRTTAGLRGIQEGAKRRAKLESWMKECGFGESVEEWMKCIQLSGTTPPDIVAKFVASTATAPSFKKVAAEVAAFADRCARLVAALAALGLERRIDSRLCAAFEAGTPLNGFETAERVATEMAFMRWLHTCTDYERRVEDAVEELQEEIGRFYPGIYQEAREGVKREMQPPLVWPWLPIA